MRESEPMLMEAPGTDRLDGDRRRAEMLRRLGPASKYYVEYGIKLRDYAISTLIKQWAEGTLRQRVARQTSVVLPLPLPSWTARHIRSIIGIAVCRSVDPFLESAILQGHWNPERGASIASFFVGRCYFAFADDYRREHQEEVEAAKRVPNDDFDLELDVVRYVQRSTLDPETTAVNRAELRHLLRLATHRRIPEIIFLLEVGMTRKDIGYQLGMTEDAVNNALRKFRGDVARAHRRTR